LQKTGAGEMASAAGNQKWIATISLLLRLRELPALALLGPKAPATVTLVAIHRALRRRNRLSLDTLVVQRGSLRRGVLEGRHV
jgi:hypothetical protein